MKAKKQRVINLQKSEVTKYRNFVSEYQVVIELDMLSQTKQHAVSHQIGALIPKGYVLLNEEIEVIDTEDIVWYDSLHNLLLKKCKVYAKSSIERIQAQLSNVVPSAKD